MQTATMKHENQENQSSGQHLSVQQKLYADKYKYYNHVFPFEDVFAWLVYNNHFDNTNMNCIKNREFSFVLQNDMYNRYLSFQSSSEYKQAVLLKMPVKLDVGACYNKHPSLHASPNFVPVLRELVFDIDLSDYDDIRTSSSQAVITQKCWRFMVTAINVLDLRLRDEFGFKHIFWVYSGRRGVHGWVCDTRALKLDDVARSAVVDYLSVVPSGISANKKVMQIMRDEFVNDTIQEKGQALLSNPTYFNKVLQFIPSAHGLRDNIRNAWLRAKDATSRYKIMLAQFAELRSTIDHPMLRRVLKHLPDKIVSKCLYPRLDVNVSTRRSHLLKAPFALHPQTNQVCVPLDLQSLDTFNVQDVPTCSSVVMELQT